MNTTINPVQQVDQAFIYIIGISFVLLFLITAVMIYFAFRYHHRRHPEPSDIRGSWKLELLWTLVPSLIALSMFVVGWNAYTGLRNAPADAIEIEVIAQQFSFIFIYPEEKESEDELVVPLGKSIKLIITSDDVLHGFFVPAFRIKVDAVPGINTHAWFLADKTGTYDILCTEYCGAGHADMTGTLKIVPESEYRQWVESDDEEEEESDEETGDEETGTENDE
jgi:cytochrome c oxidase subunit II